MVKTTANINVEDDERRRVLEIPHSTFSVPPSAARQLSKFMSAYNVSAETHSGLITVASDGEESEEEATDDASTPKWMLVTKLSG